MNPPVERTASPDIADEGRSARKRRAILEAATTAFLRNGYLGTSMDDIAARASVSKQTVYKHFANKERLFSEIVRSTVDEVIWSPYLPGLREAVGDRVRVSEIAVVGLASEGGFSSGAVRPPRGVPPAPPAGFALIEHRELPTLTYVVYRAPRPVALATTDLADLALGGEQPGVLVQMPTMRSSGE